MTLRRPGSIQPEPDPLIYVDRFSGSYGDLYLDRQARYLGLPIHTAVSHVPPNHQPLSQVELLRPTSRVFRSFDARVARRRSRGTCPRPRPLLARSLRNLVGRHRIVYSFFLWNAFDLACAVQHNRRSEDVRMVVHAAGSDLTRFSSLPPIDQSRRTRVLRAADLVLCGSAFLQRRLDAAVPGVTSTVHYLGVDVPPRYVDVRDVSGDTVRLIAVSRLHRVKGADRTIHAFAKAAATGAPLRLDIVGDGPERSNLEQLVAQLGLTARVRFHGQRTQPEVMRLIEESHLLVQHNLPLEDGSEEALGGSLLEAQALGRPVIAASSGGVPEALRDGETGLTCKPDDVDAMAECIHLLARDADLRARFGRSARAFIQKVHNAEVQDRRLQGLLHSPQRNAGADHR